VPGTNVACLTGRHCRHRRDSLMRGAGVPIAGDALTGRAAASIAAITAVNHMETSPIFAHPSVCCTPGF
jgi:hypothetical protein